MKRIAQNIQARGETVLSSFQVIFFLLAAQTERLAVNFLTGLNFVCEKPKHMMIE